jgi:hypothetical protein
MPKVLGLGSAQPTMSGACASVEADGRVPPRGLVGLAALEQQDLHAAVDGEGKGEGAHDRR